jgi:hypothetical protein
MARARSSSSEDRGGAYSSVDSAPCCKILPAEGLDANTVFLCFPGLTVWVVHGPPGPRRQSLAQNWRGHVIDEILLQKGDLHGRRELFAFGAGVWLGVLGV